MKSQFIIIIETEKELVSFKELSEIRLQEIEQLKLKLEDSNKITSMCYQYIKTNIVIY